MKLSVILPVFNEEKNLNALYERLAQTIEKKLGVSDYELIFVDDFSADASWELIESFHRNDKRVKGIKFSRNFGHHIALSAGINASQGEGVIMMDADLQDLPEEIPKLYDKFLEGYDVVYGIRRNKKHSLSKQMASNAFNTVMNSLSEVKINTHIFRIMSHRMVQVFNQFKERDRFIIGLISYAGFKEIGVEVEHGERFAGETKYDLSRMMRLALNSITAFSIKPLQLASWVGSLLTVIGILMPITFLTLRLVFGVNVIGWAWVMGIVIFIGGIQMIFIGLLGEYTGRIFLEVKQRPLYVVEKKLG